jgi:hypothetical protein
MHRGHDHHHHHDGHGAGAGHNHAHAPRPPAQWQTPHQPAAQASETSPNREPDLDLVEAAFVDGFATASDPTSFLRLAQVPFEAVSSEGTQLVLLRVEIDVVADIGALTPQLGGAGFRYDPLPARMVSRRKRLRFAYFDGDGVRVLTLGEVRALTTAAKQAASQER